jgi:hypothetical protein
MLCLNLLACAALGFDMHYLKTHRPAVADPARGFVIRQETRNPDGVYYESAHDRTIYWTLGGLDIAAFSAFGVMTYLVSARRRRGA